MTTDLHVVYVSTSQCWCVTVTQLSATFAMTDRHIIHVSEHLIYVRKHTSDPRDPRESQLATDCVTMTLVSTLTSDLQL